MIVAPYCSEGPLRVFDIGDIDRGKKITGYRQNINSKGGKCRAAPVGVLQDNLVLSTELIM